MKFLKLFMVICVIVLVAGCSSRSFENRLNVESYLSPEGNYGNYNTYAWVNYGTDQVVIRDPKVRDMVVEAIENEFKAMGLTYDAKSPDLMLGYHGAMEQKLDEEVIASYYSEDNYNLDNSPFKEIDSWEVGSLVLMVFDARDGTLLWRASAQAEIDERDNASQRKQNVVTAVHAMLATLPTEKDIEKVLEQQKKSQ